MMFKNFLKNGVRTLIVIFTMMIFVLANVGTAGAAVASPAYSKAKDGYVIDEADILSAEEESKLEDLCKKTSDNCGVDIVIITMKLGIDYSEMDRYLEAVLDNGYGYTATGDENAIIYGIDMISRADRMVKMGKAHQNISASSLDSIRQDAESYLADGDYYEGCVKYIKEVERELNDNFWYKLFLDLPVKMFISFIVAVVVLIVLMIRSKASMTVGSATYASQTRVRRREDRFINTTTTTRRIQTNNGSRSGGGGGGGGRSGSSGGHF